MDILTQYGHPPKNHMQPLTDQELSIVFEYLTQHNQVDSIESIYADVYHEPRPPPKARARPSSRPGPAAGRPQPGGKQPARTGAASPPPERPQRPQQEQAQAAAGRQQPGSRIPEKKVVDTRGGQAVNLEKYDERLETFTTERQQQGGGKQKFQGRNAQRQRGVSRAPATSAARRSRRRCAASSWRSPRRPP